MGLGLDLFKFGADDFLQFVGIAFGSTTPCRPIATSWQVEEDYHHDPQDCNDHQHKS